MKEGSGGKNCSRKTRLWRRVVGERPGICHSKGKRRPILFFISIATPEEKGGHSRGKKRPVLFFISIATPEEKGGHSRGKKRPVLFFISITTPGGQHCSL